MNVSLKKTWLEKIIFGITLLFCVFSFLLAFMCFTINLTSTSTAIKRLSNEITSHLSIDFALGSNEQEITTSENKEITPENTQSELSENKLDFASIKEALSYLERLKEIESTSVSTNLLTFLYTFLSSVLIGLGTFFMKKNVDNTKLICDSKELIEENKNKIDKDSERINTNEIQIKENEKRIAKSKTTLDKIEVNVIYAEQYLCLQQISTSAYNISTILAFSKDIATMPNDMEKKRAYLQLLGKCLPRFNESIRDLYNYFKKEPNKFYESQKLKIKQELGEIISIIRFWDDATNVIQEKTKKKWEEEITSIIDLL